MTVKEKMHAGKIYYPSGEELMREQTACLDKLYEYNATRRPREKSGRRFSKRCLRKSARAAISNRPSAPIGRENSCTSAKTFTPTSI